MLLAPAFRDASINCRRLINALEVENMSHAGTENGNLVMPYNQLVRWWHIPRRLIRQAIDEAVERGLIEERRSGWRLSYAKSMPNRFRLTFRTTREGNPPQWKPPTDEWRRYRGIENASKGSEVAPSKCHKVNRTRRSSVPLREPASVPDSTPPSISRAEGGGEGRGALVPPEGNDGSGQGHPHDGGGTDTRTGDGAALPLDPPVSQSRPRRRLTL
jgi:hypothetical protein